MVKSEVIPSFVLDRSGSKPTVEARARDVLSISFGSLGAISLGSMYRRRYRSWSAARNNLKRHNLAYQSAASQAAMRMIQERWDSRELFFIFLNFERWADTGLVQAIHAQSSLAGYDFRAFAKPIIFQPLQSILPSCKSELASDLHSKRDLLVDLDLQSEAVGSNNNSKVSNILQDQ